MEWLKRLFRKQQTLTGEKSAAQPAADDLPPATMLALARLLAEHEAGEVNCETVLDLLCEFGEMAQRGEDPTDLLPEVNDHLQLCGDCRQEYEALLRILQAPRPADPA